MIGIVEANRAGIAAIEVVFLNFLDVRHIGAPHVLAPGVDLYAVFLGLRNYLFKNVDIAVIGRLNIFDDRVLVVLREIGRATRLNSSHPSISYAVFCLKKK